jgi:hypothetical protein
MATTDGLGHLEGVAGTVGGGGANRSWTVGAGSWTLTGGKIRATTTGTALSHLDLNESLVQVVADISSTPTGITGLVMNYIDTSNYLVAARTASGVAMLQILAGVQSTLTQNKGAYCAYTSTYTRLWADVDSAGYYRVRAESGGATTLCTANPVFEGVTKFGIFSIGSTHNKLDNFVVYAKTAKIYNNKLNRYI